MERMKIVKEMKNMRPNGSDKKGDGGEEEGKEERDGVERQESG